MAERGIRPDMILIGEPTSEARLGDIVKIGRRGSVNMWVTVPGVQGHVAYPHRADNPVPKLAAVIAALEALHLDDGNDSFQPSNLEITAVETASKATNVIPGWARAQLNIRFNNLQRGEELVALVRRTAEAAAPGATVEAKISGEAFLTPPGPIYEIVSEAIRAETGDAAAALHPRRHLGRPLPDRALPGGRFRPAQRDHAQARRGGGGRGHPRPRPHLRAGHSLSACAEGRYRARLSRRGADARRAPRRSMPAWREAASQSPTAARIAPRRSVPRARPCR